MDWLITIIISKLYLWKITGSRGKTILDPFKYLIKQPLFQYLKNCRFYFTLKVYLIEPKTNLKKETSLSNEIRNRSNRFIRILRWNLWGQGSRIVRVARNPGGQPGGACRIFDLPSPSPVFVHGFRRGSPSVMADKHGQVPYVYLRVGCSSRVTRGAAPFLLLYFSPLFPSFFSFSSASLLLLLLLLRAVRSLVPSACRFRRLRYPIPI